MPREAAPVDLEIVVGAAAESRGLRRRDDIVRSSGTFWELRNLNMHRVTGLLQRSDVPGSVEALGSEIRGAFAANFKRAWWRGLAYGAVVESPSRPVTLDELKTLVDIRENRTGVLQWVVLVDSTTETATGVHTWEQVFLSPIYRATIDALRSGGFEVATAVRGKDGLMRLLTGVSDLQGVTFPEFGDEP